MSGALRHVVVVKTPRSTYSFYYRCRINPFNLVPPLPTPPKRHLITWTSFKVFLGLFQRFQHSLSQVLVLANDCVSVPDVHHLLDDTNTHNQDISLYLRNRSRLFVASVSGFHCRVESYNIAHKQCESGQLSDVMVQEQATPDSA